MKNAIPCSPKKDQDASTHKRKGTVLLIITCIVSQPSVDPVEFDRRFDLQGERALMLVVHLNNNGNNPVLHVLFTHLAPCILSPHRQSQGVSPSTVCSDILKPLDVVEDFSAEIVLDLHLRKSCGKVEDLLISQFPDFAGVMDVKARHETGGDAGTNAEERLEGLLYINEKC